MTEPIEAGERSQPDEPTRPAGPDEPQPAEPTAPAESVPAPATEPTASAEPTTPTGAEAVAGVPPASAPRTMPGVDAIVRLAVDALEEAGPELRVLSASVVLFGVAAVGIPLGSVVLFQLAIGPSTQAQPEVPPAVGLAVLIALVVGLFALVVLLVQIPLLVIATVAARLAGAPLSLREALRRSRQVFLRGLGGVIAIAFLTGIPTAIAQSVIRAAFGRTELTSGLSLAAGAMFASPWVYVLPGIVLGGVGVGEAVRRSWTIARLRWRIAITIAGLAVIGQFVVVSAASAAIGAVETVLFAVGRPPEAPTSVGPLAAVALVIGVLVLGASLIFGIQLVQFAPQASGFYAMTGYTAALDAARGGLPEPLFHRRALIFYAVGILAGLYVLATAIQISTS